MTGPYLTSLVLIALLIAAGLVGWYAWIELGDVEIGLHGWIAMGLCAAFTFLLGVGLMRLVYISHKRGFDDEAGYD